MMSVRHMKHLCLLWRMAMIPILLVSLPIMSPVFGVLAEGSTSNIDKKLIEKVFNKADSAPTKKGMKPLEQHKTIFNTRSLKSGKSGKYSGSGGSRKHRWNGGYNDWSDGGSNNWWYTYSSSFSNWQPEQQPESQGGYNNPYNPNWNYQLSNPYVPNPAPVLPVAPYPVIPPALPSAAVFPAAPVAPIPQPVAPTPVFVSFPSSPSFPTAPIPITPVTDPTQCDPKDCPRPPRPWEVAA